jgi:nitroreductase
MNQTTDFLRSLRAVREFQRKPVPDDVIQDVLEVARWSGSASNRQFGEIIVVRKPETLQALAGLGGYVAHLNPANPPRRGTRKPISELVHEERYRA